MPERVVYLERLSDVSLALVREAMPEDVTLDHLETADFDEALKKLRGAHFAIVATFPVTGELLDRASALRFIQGQGVGLDNFDLAALRRRRVVLAINPIGATSVAEHTVLLMLAALRRLPYADATLRSGGWERWNLRGVSHDLGGKTVGLAGFGRNGMEVARRLAGFGCEVIFSEVRNVRRPLYGARMVGEDELLERSDVLSLHLPLHAATENWLDAARMDRLKPGAVVINTSRGGLIDEGALVERLKSGRLGAAGLDVFAPEPPRPESLLWQLPNVVVTPHIAAGTRETYVAKMRFAFENIQRVARGRRPLHMVTA